MTRPMEGHVPSPASLFPSSLLQNSPHLPSTNTAVNTVRIQVVNLSPEHLMGMRSQYKVPSRYVYAASRDCRCFGQVGGLLSQKLGLRRRQEEEAKEVGRCQTSCLSSPRPLPVQPLHLHLPVQPLHIDFLTSQRHQYLSPTSNSATYGSPTGSLVLPRQVPRLTSISKWVGETD